jgi:hypothetical protein
MDRTWTCVFDLYSTTIKLSDDISFSYDNVAITKWPINMYKYRLQTLYVMRKCNTKLRKFSLEPRNIKHTTFVCAFISSISWREQVTFNEDDACMYQTNTKTREATNTNNSLFVWTGNGSNPRSPHLRRARWPLLLFFSLTIKDKTKISLTINILHLGQGSFIRKVRTIFTLKIIEVFLWNSF